MYFGPGKPLKVSIEVEAKEEDVGKPLVFTKLKLGRVLTEQGQDKKEPGLIKCRKQNFNSISFL